MSDLIQEYFKRDLNETERTRLGELLEGDPANAERFAQLAEQVYQSTGLPVPVQGNWLSGLAKSVPLLKTAAAVLCIAAGAAMAWQFTGTTVSQDNPDAVKKENTELKVVNESDSGFEVSHNTDFINEGASTTLPPLYSRGSRRKSSANSSAEQKFPTRAIVKDVIELTNADPRMDNNSFAYNGLSLHVAQRTQSWVTVRVLDTSNKVLRTLYDNNLNKGDWMFTWDGMSEKGIACKSGTYYIEVQSGDKSYRRKIGLSNS